MGLGSANPNHQLGLTSRPRCAGFVERMSPARRAAVEVVISRAWRRCITCLG